MKSSAPCILTINGGSSSIRFAIYEADKKPRLRLAGKVDRIGLSGTSLVITEPTGAESLEIATRQEPVQFLLNWLATQPIFTLIKAVGHRVVHGMKHAEPERITAKLLAELRRITPYDPNHLPREIELIEALSQRHPKLPQVACFDTAFHRTMPRVARLVPIPRRYEAKGIERYGFHGLSYAYLMEELRKVDPAAAKGRVILAHLGNGASLAAVQNGRSMDTSMGFTPASGLMMSTRSGDLDPGLVRFLTGTEKMSAVQFDHMANHESGLLGVSETSSDLRDLLASEARDVRAAEAVALFCYQVKKWIGSFAAALGGLDTLVFSGGIGENASLIRKRICSGLEFLGVKIDAKRNDAHAPQISSKAASVKVRVIRTNEELMIARSVCRILGSSLARKSTRGGKHAIGGRK